MNPITRMMKRYIKTPLKYALPLLFIGSLVLVSISGCTSPATTSPSPSASKVPTVTATPTVKATATPTATPAPTATPTPVNPSSLLVEHQASASGPDLSAQINDNTDSHDTRTTYYRVTIDGHDAYAAHNPNAAITDAYVFPFSNYNDAAALQASYVAEFQAHGFTVNKTEQPVSTWGENSNSILTELRNGTISISAADSATVRPGTNILNSGSEVVIFISPGK
jgi:hypothetical protein